VQHGIGGPAEIAADLEVVSVHRVLMARQRPSVTAHAQRDGHEPAGLQRRADPLRAGRHHLDVRPRELNGIEEAAMNLDAKVTQREIWARRDDGQGRSEHLPVPQGGRQQRCYHEPRRRAHAIFRNEHDRKNKRRGRHPERQKQVEGSVAPPEVGGGEQQVEAFRSGRAHFRACPSCYESLLRVMRALHRFVVVWLGLATALVAAPALALIVWEGKIVQEWPDQAAHRGPLPGGTVAASGPMGFYPNPQGEVWGLTIVVDFSDQPPAFTRDQIDAWLNQPGYSEGNLNGSVRDYFHDNSNGAVSFQNEVVGIYR